MTLFGKIEALVACTVLFAVGVGSFVLGRKSVHIPPPVTITREVPVEKIVNRDIIVTQTRIVKVAGKPDVTVITSTKTDDATDTKLTTKEVVAQAPSAMPADAPMISLGAANPRWDVRTMVGLHLAGRNPLVGLGADYRLVGPFTVGVEVISDMQGEFIGMGTLGARF